ncbi:L,D-transpeptidase family protein [Croceibacterium atlanticum]|nr:L,D-transpeptidase family protein [Croceibacterium atlanticum]
MTVAMTLALLAAPLQASAPAWGHGEIATLKRWISAAPLDALPVLPTDRLDAATTAGDADAMETQATSLALRLARMHLLGSASVAERSGWNINDTDKEMDLEPLLAAAVENGTLDAFFATLRPRHQEYSALKSAYAKEPDEAKRTTIGRNMERWRWLPRSLGGNYVMVNLPKFEAYLWRDGMKAGAWPVIVGKTSTPSVVFDTTITGVTLNPWWEIPASIVRESIGSLVRRNPALARSRGYVWNDGRYRQKPGPNNALGQMKLVMPNPYSIYMHDTPNKNLFAEDVRAFSHGCIRTGDAIGYAATLLQGVKSREEVDAIVESGVTTTLDLARPLPIYVVYFTAVADGQGGVETLRDLYNRDRRISVPPPVTGCGQE